MVLSTELTNILTLFLQLLELLGYHRRQQLLGLDKRYLYITVRIAVKSQLTGNTRRQTIEYSQVSLGEVSLNEID